MRALVCLHYTPLETAAVAHAESSDVTDQHILEWTDSKLGS